MKRLFAWSLVSISLWLIAECVCANPVSETEALMRAHQFMPDKYFSVKKYSPRYASSQTTPPFYIFNADDGGFVLVSGDDRTTPVLGYSEQGQLDLSQAPENLLYWLDSYAQQIESLDHGASASTIGASLKDAAPISPLIQTKWSQYAPYNNQCPYWPGTDQRCLTGCVATCMAQIMYYYKWPKHCPAIPAYFLSSFNQTIEALPPVDFRWNDMQLTYYNNDVGPAADAVAQLMRYCGQSVEMDYGRQESSAYMDSKVMIETFDYSENTKEIYRNNYSDATEWESIIYQELAKGHPVPYSGRSTTSGHQFICDGYDNRGYFHINLGWGGQDDAYYVLSVANGYSQDQRAIIGLEPKAVPSDYAVNSFSIVEDIFLNEKTDVRVSLTNLGNTSRERLVLWVKQRRVWALTATVDGSIEPGQTGEVMMSFIPSNVGDFEVKLTSDLEGEVVKATATIHVAEPEEKTVGDFVYLCNNDTHHAFVKGTKEDADTKTWVIPETFDTDGVTYTVVAVRSDAFFYDSRVRRLELPSTLNMIGDEAFLNCNNLQMVISHIKHPFVIHDNTFAVRTWNYDTMEFDYKESSAVLYVPEGSKSEYEAIPGWTHFAKVVEGIPHEVFAGGLRFLCMPNTKTATVIADDSYSELTEVNIPEQVECEGIACLVDSIADKAFRSSRYLKFVTLPSSLKTIGENAFFNCYRLKEVNIPEGCETIGSSAFAYCSDLQKVVLPATLSSLGDKAFGETSALVSVISHCKSPCQISENVFCISSWNEEMQSNEYKPSPATLYVPVGRKDDYIAKGWDQFAKIEEGELVDAVIGGLKYQLLTKDKTAIVLQDESYKELTEVNIPERVKYDDTDYLVIGIADNAFYQCGRITSVTFPSTLKTIGKTAFCYCYNIKELNIPEGCETIGSSAFAYCSDLQKVVLPATLSSLGDYAFAETRALASVFSHCKSPCSISKVVFCIEYWYQDEWTYGFKPSPATLYVPVGRKAEYIAKGWDQFAKISEGEPEEAVIDGLRYQLLTAEKTAIVLPDESYQEFTEVNIPEQVEYNDVACSVIGIAEEAFNSCFKITSITLPSTLKSIGESAFAYCRYIKELNIPEGCETIGNSAFFYCSELRKLVLPTILPMLGDNAFGETEALASVVSHCKSPCLISENVFGISSWNPEKHVYEHEPSPATFYVPIGSKAEYIDKGWNQFAKISEGEPEEAILAGLRYQFLSTEKTAIVFPDESYQELTEVNIPERVEYDGTDYLVVGIANAAFYDCSSIMSVTFPSTLKSIGRSAFTSCRSLQELNIPEGCEAIGRKAFAYCSGLKKIVLPATLSCLDNVAFEATSALISVISHCKSPCSIGEHVFKTWGWNEEKQVYGYNTSPATLYVPIGSKDDYIANGWDQFAAIVEDEECGIGSVIEDGHQTDDGPLYNPFGQRVTNPQKGIYIRNGKKFLIER